MTEGERRNKKKKKKKTRHNTGVGAGARVSKKKLFRNEREKGRVLNVIE